MRIKCPSCSAENDLATLFDCAAGSELMKLLSELEPTLARPLLAYLGLFRSKSRALSWDRALKLAREVLELTSNQAQLSTAIGKAVEILREKQRSGNWKPLGNHNYLKRVIEDSPIQTNLSLVSSEVPEPVEQRKTFTSKTASGMMALEQFKNGGQ